MCVRCMCACMCVCVCVREYDACIHVFVCTCTCMYVCTNFGPSSSFGAAAQIEPPKRTSPSRANRGYGTVGHRHTKSIEFVRFWPPPRAKVTTSREIRTPRCTAVGGQTSKCAMEANKNYKHCHKSNMEVNKDDAAHEPTTKLTWYVFCFVCLFACLYSTISISNIIQCSLEAA